MRTTRYLIASDFRPEPELQRLRARAERADRGVRLST